MNKAYLKYYERHKLTLIAKKIFQVDKIEYKRLYGSLSLLKVDEDKGIG